jgi:hypothetical protein
MTSQDLLHEYMHRGFVVSPEPIYSDVELEELRLRFDQLFNRLREGNRGFRNLNVTEAESESGAPDPSKGQFNQIVGFSKKDDRLRAHLTHAPLLDLVEMFIGPNIQYMEEAAYDLPPRVGRGICWHQDNGYYRAKDPNQVTTWTPLDDADLGNGCLWVVPGSHTELLPHGAARTTDRLMQCEVDESRAVPVEVKAGHVLLFHCQLAHRSRNTTSDRRRRVLNVAYMQTNSIIPRWTVTEDTHPVFRGKPMSECPPRGI